MDRFQRNDRILNWIIWSAITVSMALLLVLITSFSAQAQWPTSPHAPLVICDHAPSSQKNLRVVPDGNGGWYVLWTDDRMLSTRYAVYGQRLDAQGDLLWEPNGRLIQEVPGRSINYIAATRMNNGRLAIAYISGEDATAGDTVRMQAYDGEAAPLWAEPTLLAYPGPLPGGGASVGNYWPRLVVVQQGVFVGWGTNPMGAADYIHLARVLDDGTNEMPEQGVAVSLMNNSITAGPWAMRHDLAGGLLIERRWGNGAGAPLRALRVDPMGAPLWTGYIEVSANSNGLAYEWSTAVAPTARVNSVWAYWSNLRMAVYDTTGVLFNTSAPIDVCMQADVQENPFVFQTAEGTTVYWADNRGGNGRQVYMQRFDAEGAPQLAENGVLAMQANGSTNGFPRAIHGDDDSHIVALFAGAASQAATPGFRVGRITPEGVNLWSDTTRFAIPSLSPNGGTDYALTTDDDGGAVAIWYNWETDAIYAARLDRHGRMGDFTGIAEHRPITIDLHPNPATDMLTVQDRTGTALGHLRIHAADGRVAMDLGLVNDRTHTVALRDLVPGIYFLSSQQHTTSNSVRFIKH